MTFRKQFAFIVLLFMVPVFVFAQDATVTEDDPVMRTFKEKTEDIVEALPEPVVEKTVSVTTKIEQFRLRQAVGMAAQIEQTKIRIEELKDPKAVEEAIEAEEPTPAVAKPIQYIKLAVLYVVYFLFNIKAVFYIAAVLLAFSVLRGLVQNLRHRGEYD